MTRRFVNTALVWLFTTGPLQAATNPATADEIPQLRPPRGEIPPSFWERYGLWMVFLGVLMLALVGLAVWFLTRPKAMAVVPAEVQARQDLQRLSEQPEEGAVLSHVSQVFRHYVAAAFSLPSGELTTAEFCALIAQNERLGAELATAITEFSRRCDQRKFAPPAPGQPLGAAAQALKLLDLAEARREQLRRDEAAQAASRPTV
jgi:hypothetical protein